MSHSSNRMRTPLSKVRFLGSAKSGTSDFWYQRLTAIGLGILAIPVIVIFMMLLGRNHAAAVQILASPLVAIILMLFVVATVWHMKIGLQVILEDYVHNESLKLIGIIANALFSITVGVASLYALLKISAGV